MKAVGTDSALFEVTQGYPMKKEYVFDNVDINPSWFMLLPGDMNAIDEAVGKALDGVTKTMTDRICKDEGIPSKSRERNYLRVLVRKHAEDYLMASLRTQRNVLAKPTSRAKPLAVRMLAYLESRGGTLLGSQLSAALRLTSDQAADICNEILQDHPTAITVIPVNKIRNSYQVKLGPGYQQAMLDILTKNVSSGFSKVAAA